MSSLTLYHHLQLFTRGRGESELSHKPFGCGHRCWQHFHNTKRIQSISLRQCNKSLLFSVVDESGSMGGNRMTTAQNAIRQFINEMGPYDRTAIVGFSGGSSARVLQSMTSDKTLLLKAVDNLRASGNTNINTGAKLGVQQVVGETNPTTVIVFSDGANNDDVTTSSEVINLATGLSTNIYTIALETSSFDVLKTLADGTGGTFTNAPSASQLTSIYTTIRSMPASQASA